MQRAKMLPKFLSYFKKFLRGPVLAEEKELEKWILPEILDRRRQEAELGDSWERPVSDLSLFI